MSAYSTTRKGDVVRGAGNGTLQEECQRLSTLVVLPKKKRDVALKAMGIKIRETKRDGSKLASEYRAVVVAKRWHDVTQDIQDFLAVSTQSNSLKTRL